MPPPLQTSITLMRHSPWLWHVSRAGKRLGTVNGDSVDGFTARDNNHHSIGRGYISAEAALQAWASPPDGNPALTHAPRVSLMSDNDV